VLGRLPSVVPRGESPSRLITREGNYILLRVAAVHSQSVKLHQFTGIVFV